MRRFPLLLLLYVTLDFANPLMPGAVRFERGAVEFVQADRVARRAATELPSAATLEPDGPVLRDGAAAKPVPAPEGPRPPVRRHVRRAAPPHPEPPPSPTGDH